MLFVGMPSPFKETWCERHRHALEVPLIMGVGGSFDVLAGLKAGAVWADAPTRPETRRAATRGIRQDRRVIRLVTEEKELTRPDILHPPWMCLAAVVDWIARLIKGS